MKNKLVFLIIALTLVGGCTQQSASNVQEQPIGPSGKLDFTASIDESTIQAGLGTQMEISMTNGFTKPLENIDITVEPSVSGLTYEVTSGPIQLEDNETKGWDIDLTTAEGMTSTSRHIDLSPVVCFDYSQEYKAYFRVTNGDTPSAEIDISQSDTGPIGIIVEGLRSFDTAADEKLDIRVKFDRTNVNNVNGGSYYCPSDPMVCNKQQSNALRITSADIKLDSVNGNLILSTNEVNMNQDVDNNCGDENGFSVCYFSTPPATYYENAILDFDIKPVGEISEELESTFIVAVNYRYCFKSSSPIGLTVEARSRN